MGQFTEWRAKYTAEYKRWDMAEHLDDKSALKAADERMSELEIELSHMMSPERARLCDAAPAMREALGAALWMINNIHNAADPKFDEFVKAAEIDCRSALAACEPTD